MQIITIDDAQYAELLQAWKASKEIGKYWKEGRLQIVCATSQFMLVSSPDKPDKIAIKPARSLSEAEQLALRLLSREEERGSQVERPEAVTADNEK